MTAAAAKRKKPKKQPIQQTIEQRVNQMIRRHDDQLFQLGTRSPIEHIILDQLSNEDRGYPSIIDTKALHDTVVLHHSSTDSETRGRCIDNLATIVLPSLYENSTDQWREKHTHPYCGEDKQTPGEDMRTALTRSIDILMTGSEQTTDKYGETPARMATRNHYLVEHSLQTAKLLTMRREDEISQGISFGVVIGGLLHDYLEDVPDDRDYDTRLKELSDIIGEGLDQSVREEISLGLAAVKRVTLRKGSDYFREIESITKMLSKKEESKKREQKIIGYACLIKLADKISGAPILFPFNMHKRLRLGGKIRKTINVSREYLDSLDQKDYLAREIENISVQAAIYLERSMGWAARQIHDELYHLFGKKRKARSMRSIVGHNKRKVNGYIRERGLEHVETNEEVPEKFREVAGTLFNTKLLGMHLNHDNAQVPVRFRKKGESNNDAVERFRAMQSAYSGRIPLITPKQYINALRFGPNSPDSKEMIQRYPATDDFKNPVSQDAQQAYKVLSQPFLGLQALARKYAIFRDFCLPGL